MRIPKILTLKVQEGFLSDIVQLSCIANSLWSNSPIGKVIDSINLSCVKSLFLKSTAGMGPD